jgi:hypothetical protein
MPILKEQAETGLGSYGVHGEGGVVTGVLPLGSERTLFVDNKFLLLGINPRARGFTLWMC